jgi:SAM-dependent methyltransferase
MKLSIQKIIRLSKRYVLLVSPLKTKQCCLYGHKVAGFLAHTGDWKNAPQLMTALRMVDSDIDNSACPVCYYHDRERHQWLYWQAAGVLSRMHGAHILHFAPEPHLAQRIIAQQPAAYIKADLYPNAADIQTVDLLNMPFTDGQFDILIANHVMEYVDNVNQVLTKIHRVLKPGSWTILQTPYCSTLQHTWEDAGIQSATQRLVVYGQDDHIRLFGQDIFATFESAGFTAHIGTHSMLLKDMLANYYGVNEQESLMLFNKNEINS